MPQFKTRHSEDFDLLSDALDRRRSPYAESYSDYPTRCQHLASLVGSDTFIWCIPGRHKFRAYEHEKPVEWVINVSEERILGFVDEARWYQYLAGGDHLAGSVFSTSRPPSEEYSVLVAYPLRREELVRKIVFDIISIEEANVASVEDFRGES